MAATQKAERLAYDAGRALPRLVWDDDATEKQHKLGEHHCPFSEAQPEERAAWLRGLRDALESQLDDKERANLLKRIDDEVKGADHVR